MNYIEYDEFSMFHENAEEYGLRYDGAPLVRRVSVEVEPGRKLSALAWQEGEPELVLLHGGSQNAHTWDTVAMALDRPLVAMDLPAHGHSDGLAAAAGPGQARAASMAADIAIAIRLLAPTAAGVVGMSLGGLTAISLLAEAPELVRRIVLVDILPGVKPERAKHIADFIDGPRTFDDLDKMLERTSKFNPTRSLSSLRRGILHNAVQQDDGTWMWRWAQHLPVPKPDNAASRAAVQSHQGRSWELMSATSVPLLLVRGMRPDSVLGDDSEAELLWRVPTAQVARVADAGHSVQGDQPVELARLIEGFVFGA